MIGEGNTIAKQQENTVSAYDLYCTPHSYSGSVKMAQSSKKAIGNIPQKALGNAPINPVNAPKNGYRRKF